MAHSVNELNELFQKAEQALQSHFAEIRSNILLDAGHHHQKSDRFANSRIMRGVDKTRKIRIVKNHISVITRFIRNSIQNRSPDGACFPRNDKELADMKSAELNESVYQFLKSEEDLPSIYAKIIQDFVVQGEAYLKIFWDPYAGAFSHYENTEEGDDPEEDPNDGDESMAKVIRMDRRRPVFKGKIVYERIPAYNLLTDPDADSERTVQWVCVRKFMCRKKLMKRYAGDKEKSEAIKNAGKDKKDWFDGFTGIYKSDSGDEVEIREFYFKPSETYPEGRFYFAVGDHKHGIIEDGELPDGFPIFSAVYDDSPENPRGFSPIKNLRSFQAEINRTAAAAIMESIILGHSTILYPHGEKPQTTGIGNGIKGIAYHSVNPPTVLPGRTGDQFVTYMEKIIEEMYRVAMVPQHDEDKAQSGANDAQAMLGRAMKDKMRFSLYAEKIESMICKIIGYSLKLARRYLPDDEIIPIVGKTEAVNLAEFKNTQPSQFQIKIMPRSDDFTSVYGKSLQIIQALQYVGNQLPPSAIASMVRRLPFLNGEAVLREFTVMEDQGDAMIMQLDRGVEPFKFDTDHAYMLQRLNLRMNENDFQTLPQHVQLLYQDRVDWHAAMEAQRQQEAQAATAGYLPTGGGLVSVDYYVSGENGSQKRARLPYEAVDWLVKKLAQQGSDVSKITNMPMADQAAIGRSNMQAGMGGYQLQPSAPTPGPEGMPMTG